MDYPTTKLARSVFKQAFADNGIAVDSISTHGRSSIATARTGNNTRLVKARALNNTYPCDALKRANELFNEHGLDVHIFIGTSYIECLAEVSK